MTPAISDQQLLEDILRREGGFVDHPADRGGPTNWGITLPTLEAWRGQPVSVDELRALPRGEAAEIYRELFIRRPRLDLVQDEALRDALVDWGVHSHPRTAIRALQRIVGAAPDGILGPQTLARLAEMPAALVYRRVVAARCRFLGRLITDDPSQAVHAAGWCARLAEFIEA